MLTLFRALNCMHCPLNWVHRSMEQPLYTPCMHHGWYPRYTHPQWTVYPSFLTVTVRAHACCHIPIWVIIRNFIWAQMSLAYFSH